MKKPFTRSPWQVQFADDKTTLKKTRVLTNFQHNMPDFYIAETTGGGVKKTLKEQNANARLVAAAPELFDACERAFNLIKESGFTSGLIEDEFDATLKQLESAMKKAVGQK